MVCLHCGKEVATGLQPCPHCGSRVSLPYAVSPATLGAPAALAELEEARYAGLWRRVAAFAVDSLLLGVVGELLGIAFSNVFATLGQSGRLIGFLIAGAYVIPSHRRWGQTLGKRLLGIRVRSLDGGPVSIWASSSRYLALAIPWFLNGVFFTAPRWPGVLMIVIGVILGSVLFIGIFGNGYLLVFNRPSRRLIHDWVAGTVVMRATPQALALPAEGMRATPVHLAIVGLIPVLICAVLGWVALRVHVTKAQIAQMQLAQAALNRLPGVLQATLTDQQNVTATGRARVISVRLWMKDPGVSQRRSIQRLAIATIFRQYPSSQAADRVAVVFVSGFDIGIASLWRQTGEVYPVTEWQRLLDAK